MGYIRHDAIICTGWEDSMLQQAHKKATKIFQSVTEITPPQINGYRSFLIGPDGSKEGWTDSEMFDEKRAEFKRWLKDKNLFVDWVEVSFGGDEPEYNTKVVEFGNYHEKE